MTIKKKFEVGDVVELKSGGPDMTIRYPETSLNGSDLTGNYGCQWFENNNLEGGTFPGGSLKLSDEDT